MRMAVAGMSRELRLARMQLQMNGPGALSEEAVDVWCSRLLDPAVICPSFEHCVNAIPSLDSLDDLRHGTRVLVRVDLNVPIAADGTVSNESRLQSLLETLRFGREHGWIQILHGHIGVDGRDSLQPVAARVGALLGCGVQLLEHWMNEETGEIEAATGEQIGRRAPGDVVMLENARRSDLETCLWRPRPASLTPLVPHLARYARSVRERLATVHVNEAFAASNADLSSALVPLAMDRVALGRHVAKELRGPVRAARSAEIVVFSGAKFNKLDDLEGIVRRGQVRLVIAGGLLALPLLQAEAESAGRSFELGRAEEVPPGRREQAQRLLGDLRRRGMELLLPIDFVLEDGSVVERIPAGRAQRDVGPKTLALFARRLEHFAEERPGMILFHNGVLGQFERPEFETGTRNFLSTLQRLHDAGARIYVGGGEGGTALERLGDPAKVTHCFTAGTTILKALGASPIPYVWALYQAATRGQRLESDDAV